MEITTAKSGAESLGTPRVAAENRRREYLDLAIWVVLIVSTLAVYAQVGDFEFVNFDDGIIVTQNTHVRAGLTPASIRWALTAVVSANWMPVTLLSHIADAELFELQSGMHHVVNLLFHILAAALLYSTLLRATGARWCSAFVAFVFALHPLHVESVAWISERKDVLGAFFWFLGLYGYVRYSESPSRGRYYLVVAAPFCLGLMSKPMLVTFPFVLMLLDIWPLRRMQWPKTIWEKLPLFALSAVISGVTYFAQSSQGAIQGIPLTMRITNAFVSYLTYIRQMFWPTSLAVFYPFPLSIPRWEGAACLAVVTGISVLAILAWRKYPYFTVGWLWYVGTLVPVIGFLQAGKQAHADRYMYLPMVGLLVILAWGAADLVRRWPRSQPFFAVAAVASCAAFMVLTVKQTAYWQNSGTLYEHTLEVTQDNWLAENNLGTYMVGVGRLAEAYPHFEKAARIDPTYASAYNNLGAVRLQLEDCAAAIPHFEEAVRVQPDFSAANYNLGGCRMMSGDYASAIPYFESAIRAQPAYLDARVSLAASLAKIPGRGAEAVREYEAALKLDPGDPRAHAGLGTLLAETGRTDEAIIHLEIAQRIRPDEEMSKVLDRLRAGRN